jgi:predicted translin family RNA/ssDNA-binding protein
MARDASGYTSDGASTTSKEDDDLEKNVRETVLDPEMYNNIVHDGSATSGEITVHPRAPRLGSLGHKMEDYARYRAFRHFLSEGKLLPPNAACFLVAENDIQRNVLTDEEYLGGACIGLCHDIAKHVVTRASIAVEDASAVPFIKRSRDAVSMILEELLLFDFRNGPLRRKYDGTKYALKTIETVLYELSVAGAVGGHKGLMCSERNIDYGGPPKKTKVDEECKEGTEDVTMQEGGGESSVIHGRGISEIRERMNHRDQQREVLIKTCRDGQKAAKQAIFAMHRGDVKRASKLLNECETCVNNKLLPILDEEPTIRYGSFSGLLEEYVEGLLFHTWLQSDEGSGGNGPASGRILLPDEIPLKISTEDYLGGLCDLTGEIGRYAVARGTVRDKESVKLCLESNKSIYMTLKMLGRLPPNINKKVGMVSKSVEKLERLLYEQSLMIMTGRKEFTTSVEENSGFGNDTEDN